MKNILLSILFMCVAICSADAQIITTIAGKGYIGSAGDNGPAIDAEVSTISGLCFDVSGNLFIADDYNNKIRKITPSGMITTIAGNGMPAYSGDGLPATMAQINRPTGVTVDIYGNVYIADLYNNCIRKITTTGIIYTVAGNGVGAYGGDGGPATDAQLNWPYGVAVDNVGNIFIADGLNNRIRMVNSAGIITTVAGNGNSGNSGDGGLATSAELRRPYDVKIDKTGSIYVSDADRIRKFNLGGNITTIAGTDSTGYNGDNIPATTANIKHPQGIAIDDSGNLYIAETLNHRIRKVNTSGIITTITGNGIGGYNGDGIDAISAEIYGPGSVAVDAYGNLYIGDSGNRRIRRIRYSVSISVMENVGKNVYVYPNPTKGKFIATVASGINEPVQITITNIIGQTIREMRGITNEQIAIDIDVSAGGYFVTAATAAEVRSSKIVVVK